MDEEINSILEESEQQYYSLQFNDQQLMSFLLSNCCLVSNQLKPSSKSLQKRAIKSNKLDPLNPDAYFILGECLKDFSPEDYKKVFKYCLKAAELGIEGTEIHEHYFQASLAKFKWKSR